LSALLIFFPAPILSSYLTEVVSDPPFESVQSGNSSRWVTFNLPFMSVPSLFSLARETTLNHSDLFNFGSNLSSKSLLVTKVLIDPLEPLRCSILTVLTVVRRDGLKIGDLSIQFEGFGEDLREDRRVRSGRRSSHALFWLGMTLTIIHSLKMLDHLVIQLAHSAPDVLIGHALSGHCKQSSKLSTIRLETITTSGRLGSRGLHTRRHGFGVIHFVNEEG
jgi:hypothetical protein